MAAGEHLVEARRHDLIPHGCMYHTWLLRRTQTSKIRQAHQTEHREQINHNQSSRAKRFGTGRSESPVFHVGHMAAVHIVLVNWELRSPMPFMSRTEFACQGVGLWHDDGAVGEWLSAPGARKQRGGRGAAALRRRRRRRREYGAAGWGFMFFSLPWLTDERTSGGMRRRGCGGHMSAQTIAR